jgi:hypothetical protein
VIVILGKREKSTGTHESTSGERQVSSVVTMVTVVRGTSASRRVDRDRGGRDRDRGRGLVCEELHILHVSCHPMFGWQVVV